MSQADTFVKDDRSLQEIRDEESLLSLPSEIVNKYRLMILLLLHRHGYMDFNELKGILGITEGNLASHINTLEKSGLVKIEKEFEHKKPKTIYHLSENGDERFTSYLKILKQMIE